MSSSILNVPPQDGVPLAPIQDSSRLVEELSKVVADFLIRLNAINEYVLLRLDPLAKKVDELAGDVSSLKEKVSTLGVTTEVLASRVTNCEIARAKFGSRMDNII